MRYLKTYESSTTTPPLLIGENDEKAQKIAHHIYKIFFQIPGEDIDVVANNPRDFGKDYNILVLFEIITDETIKYLNKFNEFMGTSLWLEIEKDPQSPNEQLYITTKIELTIDELDKTLRDLEALARGMDPKEIKKFNL